jgi:hypothetical protein
LSILFLLSVTLQCAKLQFSEKYLKPQIPVSEFGTSAPKQASAINILCSAATTIDITSPPSNEDYVEEAPETFHSNGIDWE